MHVVLPACVRWGLCAVHTCIHIHVCVLVSMSVCTQVCVHVCLSTCLCVSMCLCIQLVICGIGLGRLGPQQETTWGKGGYRVQGPGCDWGDTSVRVWPG